MKDLVDSKINKFLRRFGAVAPNNGTYDSRSQYDPQDNNNSAERTAGMVNVNFLLMGITSPPVQSNPLGVTNGRQILGNYRPYSPLQGGYESTEWNVQPQSFISSISGDFMQTRGTFANPPWPGTSLPYYGVRAPYTGPFNDFGYGGGYPFPYGRLPGLYGPGPIWPVF